MKVGGFQSVDIPFRAWALKHQLDVYDAIQGFPAKDSRWVYIWSERGECFQIWIDKPDEEQVCVHAGDIETRNDEVFEQQWVVSVADLEQGLDEAAAQIQRWIARA